MPMGMGGGVTVRGLTGMEKAEGLAPMRTAMACSYWARATPRLMAADWTFWRVFWASTTEILSPMPVSYWAWA